MYCECLYAGSIIFKCDHDPISEPFSVGCADDRNSIIEMVPHAADLSNPLTPAPYFKKWASLIIEEFNRQCDREAAMGLDVTAFMNCRSERSR